MTIHTFNAEKRAWEQETKEDPVFNQIIEKPIVFFDIETTGVSFTADRIIQFAGIKIMPNNEPAIGLNIRINPLITIPAEATAVHSITNEMVNGCPPFKSVAPAIGKFIADSDLAGFNSNQFDVPFLYEEFARAELNWDLDGIKTIDVYQIECKLFPRTLEGAYKRYFDKEIKNAHDAMSDICATIEVLQEQLPIIESPDPKLISSVETFLSDGQKKTFDFGGKIYYNNDEIPCWSFGKNKDKPIANDMDYVRWVLTTDFPAETKQKIRNFLNI